MNTPRCRNCGTRRKRRTDKKGWQGGHDWCGTCYNRWYAAGQPKNQPPPEPQARGRVSAAAAANRRENYYWLRDEQHLTREQAADRLRISERTAWRYEARRKAAPA